MFDFPSGGKEQMRLIALLGELRGILDVLCQGWNPSLCERSAERIALWTAILKVIDIARKIERESHPDDYGPTEDFSDYSKKE